MRLFSIFVSRFPASCGKTMTLRRYASLGEATGLKGQQYSWLSSIVYLAQLGFQPLSSFALVKFPVKWWVLFNLLGCKWQDSAATESLITVSLRP
jgi:hypothetical protein